MSNNHTLHLSGCIVLTLILAALAGMQPQAIVADTFDDYIIHQDSLNCVIALSGHPGEKEGKSVGLNRDMLQYFGDFANVDVDIVPDNSDLSYLDSLKDGKVDIVDKISKRDFPKIKDALAGFCIIARDGKVLPDTHSVAKGCHPRTAYGLSADRRYLYIIAIDGRQKKWSLGAKGSAQTTRPPQTHRNE